MMGFFSMDALDSASFRFKDVDDMIDLCIDEKKSQYSLILSLKYPPKLYEKIWDLEEEDSRPRRSLQFGSITSNHFGQCLSLRLSLSSIAIDTLLVNKGMEELVKFGMFPKGFVDKRNIRKIDVVQIGTMEACIQATNAFKLLHVNDARLGKSFFFKTKCYFFLSKITFFFVIQGLLFDPWLTNANLAGIMHYTIKALLQVEFLPIYLSH